MDHGMHGMAMSPSSSPSSDMHNHQMMIMHMTFFWDNKAEILFSGWPGTRPGLYLIALVSIVALAFAVELLSNQRLVDKYCGGSMGSKSSGLLQTLVHGIRVGLAYLVMLAVMSFNGGVFVAAVVGHVLGFMLFRSNIFCRKEEITSDDFRSC